MPPSLWPMHPPWLKIKEVPSETENEKKEWLDSYNGDVHSNAAAGQSKAATLFSLFEPSGFYVAAQSFLASFSLFSWPLSFQLRPLQAWLVPGAHSMSVGSTSASEGTDRFQSMKIDRTASLLKLRSTISICSTIYWQFHLWLGKGNCEESSVLGETWKRAKQLPTWQGSRQRRAQRCLRHRWAKRPRLRPDILWSPIRWPKTKQLSSLGIVTRN